MDVVAVEPLDRMRAILASKIGHARALSGRAEALPLDDASVDGAVVADAWHWFDGARAADELHRVVRAGGGVVVCVRVVDWETVDDTPAWARELTARLDDLGAAADHPSRGGTRASRGPGG